MKKEFYKIYFELEKDNWWFRVRRNIIFWLLKTYCPTSDVGQYKILDYGCGSGFLVGQLQEMGYGACGIDVSEEAVRIGAERGVKNLYIEGINFNFPDESFDAILAMDVIEHIEDDVSVMKKLTRLLKPGGKMIITVPAYMWMWGVQDEVAHHYRRYTMNSVLKLIKNRPDLSVIRKTYFNTFLFVPAAVVRLISKAFNLKSRESDFDINNQFLNKTLYAIFNFEAQLLKFINFFFGVSILLVLKKNE